MSIFQNTDKGAIGIFLRRKREEGGYSQHEIAERLGYKTSQIISSYEKGERFPPIEKMTLLLKTLNISNEELSDAICKSDLKGFNRLFKKK